MCVQLFFVLALIFGRKTDNLLPSLFSDLREHAILTLHILLDGNKENQAVVQSMERVDLQGGEDGDSVLDISEIH
jgi:hypothetical protein